MPSYKNSSEYVSTFEWRKEAPLWYYNLAQNAWLCAKYLYDASKLDNLLVPSDYFGTPSVALFEGYLRESAISLELILKAVICIEIEQKKI